MLHHVYLYGCFCGFEFVIKEFSFGTYLRSYTVQLAIYVYSVLYVMLLFSRITLFIVLAVVVQCVGGDQRIIHVSELFSDEDFLTSGEADSSLTCCVYGNCSCNSLDHTLANLTTSNVLVNITTDVMLSLLVEVSNVENVSIIGHNKPTVNCKSAGRVHFTFCHNCIIQGIVWNGCGTINNDTNTEPGLRLTNSSNVTIQNCCFHHSIGQAVVLSEVSGDVNIEHCEFVNNTQYRDHGAAIHCSFYNVTNLPPLLFTISNCTFTYNKFAESLVYINNRNSEHHNNITFYQCMFLHNQGVSIYVVNQKLHLKGKNLFQSNRVNLQKGAGIYITDHSIVIFGENSSVAFIKNSAGFSGGAMSLNYHSSVLFDQNSRIKFSNNHARVGIVYSEASSNVTFKGNCEVIFNGNLAISHGAAIYSAGNSNVIFTGNSKVTFNNNLIKFNNRITDYGGAIYSFDNSYIYFKENSTTTFSNNTASYGGAISSVDSSHIFFEGNSTTTFGNNSANIGGAIFSDNSYISFEGNCTTIFDSNTNEIKDRLLCYEDCPNYGGAIFSTGKSCISFKGNSATMFDNNISNRGGAIYSADHSYIYFEGNSTTSFSNNAVDGRGTLFSVYNSLVSFEGNSTTMFNSNIAVNGGAISSTANSSISFEGNSATSFNSNIAGDAGGAVFSVGSYVSFEGNSTTMFNNNIAGNEGGAVSGTANGYIYFTGNSTTVFNNNIANDDGGAISSYDSYTTYFEDNSITIFKNNTAHNGGAVYSYNTSIHFREFSTVMFENNNADDGGAINCHDNSGHSNYISFEDNSIATFNNNTATYSGGAVYTYNNSISFKRVSTVMFGNNIAVYGGAVFAEIHSDVVFSDNSTVKFTENKATFGATIYSNGNSKILVKEDSIIMFDDVSAKWCKNTCLPYTGQSDVVTIDGNGIIWCSNQEAFLCLSIQCCCKNLEDLLINTKNVGINRVVNITDKVMILSSVITIKNHFYTTIIGHNNLTVICVNGGRLILYVSFGNMTIEGITWIGCGGYSNVLTPVILIDSDITPTIDGLYFIANVKIQKNSFQHSIAPAIESSTDTVYLNIEIDHCSFINNNHYRGHGTAMHFSPSNAKYSLNDCNLINNGPVESVLYITQPNPGIANHVYINNCNFHNNQGIPVYLSHYITLHINDAVLFQNNIAENGAGIHISDHSTVIFGGKSNVKFINNSVYQSGAAIFQNSQSNITFEEGSLIRFNNNKATNGTIYSKANSNVTFMATCEVTFSGNSATQFGAAIYLVDNSHVTFTGNSNVTFNNNVIPFTDVDRHLGGTIFSESYSCISFEGNSTTLFSSNTATFGAAIFSLYYSSIIFKDNSRVMFARNSAQKCGTLTSALSSNITFTEDSEVTFNANTVLRTNLFYESSAGAICTFNRTSIAFSGHSFVRFTSNRADRGGAVVFSDSEVSIEKHSTVMFENNTAMYSSGGALICSNNSNFTIKGNSNVTFNCNQASHSGGAMHLYNMCKIIFKENSTSTFINNAARNNGGAVLCSEVTGITFEGNSMATFDSNTADYGGTFYSTASTITYKGSSMILFHNNEARQNGGVGYFTLHSKVLFEGVAIVKFNNNEALYGGAIFANGHSNITLTESSNLSFVSNEATQDGGAGYFYSHGNFAMNDNALLTFNDNKALRGGAVCIDDKIMLILTGNSTALFHDNLATTDGGALSILNDSSITLKDHITMNFTDNSAQYGGAIYLDTTAHMVNNSHKNGINFKNNIAKFKGESVYQEVTELCNSDCLNNTIFGISNELITTPPTQLQFYDPAICIDNDNDTQCNNYYVQNIMLGREIISPACVLDYYKNQIIDSTQFLVHGEIHSNYTITGPTQILISCNDTFQGISITGNEALPTPKNFTIIITLNIDHNADWKEISVNLVVGLSPCHSGFWQYPSSKKCECYNANDIVFCSSGNSTIKRGYWFGSVTGKPTVTFCPINYCNFTCCETVNGYYHLSPVRDNQCRSHRSGTACGSCTNGYTLSFDSTECVNIQSCTAGQTVLVTLLTVIYWIVMVIAVFAMMYYKVGIGYLYGIMYYYSILDILLSQNLQAFRGLYLTVNILSSFSKITPQFLGELCLTTGISGIDQQFIHYIHPSAVILILVVISLSARRSRRVSTFISRGIIHVICLLLLLSYTSVASTSLLLIRSLTFYEVDKVYTYLSPDIEYFHGRHLAYGIIALLCTVFIVIGLPLLLTLEPFLNRKFNFVKIKPLLDQFQGCYKDKYRCFAGYYMICRLLIITIVIANSSNDFVANYLLITVCGIIALIHLIVKPYNKEIFNKLDGAILQLIIFITALRLFDDFSSPFVITIASVLMTLPLLSFIAIALYLHKDNLKKIATYFIVKDESPSKSPSNDENNETPMKEFHIIVDDSMRKNVTIFDV